MKVLLAINVSSTGRNDVAKAINEEMAKLMKKMKSVMAQYCGWLKA